MRIVTDEKDRQAYKEFLEKHERCNFQQSPEWAKVKGNWINEIVLAEDESGKIIGAVSILIRKIPIFGNIMYSSRGPTCDIHDISVMKQLTDGIKELAKKYKAIVYKAEPDILSSDEEYRKIVTNLGYKIKDNAKNFREEIQPRYVFRLDIKNKTEDEIFAGFHSKTRYNVRLAIKKGVEVKEGTIHLGDTFTLSIDQQKRRQITANHSATHILQKALQETLGDHISQAGSYVDDKVLRFDFTHFEKISAELLKEIEEKVNQIVFEGRPVVIKNMTKEEALASGAMALFDEKYGDVVRVVNIGDYSIELCGGCHVSNSSEIGLFKIVSEESVGSGIRRIVAQSGLAAYNAMVHEKETVDTIASTLNLKNRKDVVNKVEALKEELKEAKVEVEQLSAKLNAIQAASKANDIEEINGVKVLYVEEQLENAKAKQLTFDFRDQLESGIVVLVSKYEEKCSYFVSVSKDLVGQYKAGNIIKAINEVVDGRGGGKPDFAQGGCAINDNISKIKGALKNIL